MVNTMNINTEFNKSIHSVSFKPSTQDINHASSRINVHMGHAYQLLKQLENQNGHNPQVAEIYEKASTELFQVHENLANALNPANGNTLSKKEIKDLNKAIKTSEKQIAQIIQKAHIEAVVQLGGEKFRSELTALSKGGFEAKLIRFFALISSTKNAAVEAFKQATSAMDQASRTMPTELQDIKTTDLSSVQKDQLEQMKAFTDGISDVKRRAGVVGLNGIYRVKLNFSEEKIQKQVKSFSAQNISQQVRTTMTRTVSFEKEGQDFLFTSTQTPLNAEFDKALKTNGSARVFEKIFGKTGGISSANRQETHLINGWESNLKNSEDKIVYQALRHAITSDKYETNATIRKENSKQAAGELLKAAVLQHLSDIKMSLEDAQEQGINLNFNSVSLVTPDDLRAIGSKGANEKNMLNDQISALQSYAEQNKSIDIDGYAIGVNLNINTFNFGVNAGAVKIGFGTINQSLENKKAFQGLKAQAEALINNEKIGLLEERAKLQSLLDDITFLMESPKAYLDGDNQYEIGAKIINLSNGMDNIQKGTKCAFNCMSGKDRTGMMDGVAKAFAIMNEINGKFPSHEELKSDPEVRKQFQEIFVPIMKEMGGLDITRINTGATGYKVGKEAKLAGLPEEDFLEMMGLSKTTSS